METVLKEYQVYLFDMDGTLVNSEPLKGKALALACGDYGSNVDFNLYKEVMGESWSVVTGHFFTHANISPNWRSSIAIFVPTTSAYWPKI